MRNGNTTRFSVYARRQVTDWSSSARTPSRATSSRFVSICDATSQLSTASTPDVPQVTGGGIKRCFDVSAATAAILFLIPLFCLIALAIKLTDRGPVLYRHKRIGKNGVSFDCLKFRTMVTDAEQRLRTHLAADPEAAREWHEKHKLTADPRVTSLGVVLRKTSLDELPQLFNILKGDMSVVGPRPIVSAETMKYGEYIHHYLRARPGLTGPWQVSGRNDVDYRLRVQLDTQYVEDWSFWRDLVIIIKTVRVVTTARGCY